MAHWVTLPLVQWEGVKVVTGVAYVGVTVGAPLLCVTEPDPHWETVMVMEGGVEPLMVSVSVPVPLPTSLPVLLPVPKGGLGEWVWDTVQLRLPLPLTVPPLGLAG